MHENAFGGAGAEWPFLVAALQAYSKLLHLVVASGNSIPLADALFAQLALLHRAARCDAHDVALVLYQHGTWLYAEAREAQRARDTLSESSEELARGPAADADAAAAGGAAQADEETQQLEHAVRPRSPCYRCGAAWALYRCAATRSRAPVVCSAQSHRMWRPACRRCCDARASQ
jgi:hypothetical protein